MIRLFPPRWALILAGLAVMGACLSLILVDMRPRIAATHSLARSMASRAAARPVPPSPIPEAPEAKLLPLTPIQAKQANAGMAFSTAPIEAARPFLLPTVQQGIMDPNAAETRAMAADCLAAAIYYEAASESEQGQRAVAQVVLNRVRHPAFPKSVCGVVYQGMERTTGCQFTFTCDGSLARRPSESGWERAHRIALAALAGRVEPSVGTATHYHTDWVVPYWAPSLDKITMIGAHIFYRWKGYWGHRAAFDGAYAGESMTGIPYHMDYARLPETETDLGVGEGRVRLLADQMLPPRAIGAAAAPKLRADEEQGTLLADQQAGRLDETRLRGVKVSP